LKINVHRLIVQFNRKWNWKRYAPPRNGEGEEIVGTLPKGKEFIDR